MSTINEKQYATAKWLAAQVRDADPGSTALWNLTGAVGAGKSSVLRKVREVLDSHLVPIMISAPGDQVDAAPIALIEMASQLEAANLMNGEMATLNDVSRSWSDKLHAVAGAIEDNAETVVLLCDEPTRWYHHNEALLDDTPDYAARSLAEWIAESATCRRIITGRLPTAVIPQGITRAPRLDDGAEFLRSNDGWNSLASVACDLSSCVTMPLANPSVWQARLLVALGRFKDPSTVARQATSDIPANVLLEELFDLIDLDSCDAFKAALIRMSLARTPLESSSLEALASGLSATDCDVIKVCLCESVEGRLALHPLVRQEVIDREQNPKRLEMNRQWKISADNRRGVHQQLRELYSQDNGSSLRSQLESLHHEVLGESTRLPEPDERLRFDYQLHEIGRTLSYVFRDHRRAAEIFRIALRINPQSAYSHHYLAFNLDWLADKPTEVEEHYKTATEIQPSHPWWWSRWISYLATRGQIRQARFRWREALDAMSISPDDSPRWIFMSLHRWVARWLLHWAELEFAEEVLRAIPPHVSDSDTSIQAEWDLLKALREAERDAAVFPLSVPAKEWWAPVPHTDLPSRIDGDQLHSWMPARVEAVDRENCQVSFLAARRPETRDGPIDYEEIRLPWEKIKLAAYRFRSTELASGMYVELAFYGTRKRMRIGLHRDTVWNDARLLPLVPQPDRWYQRAVSTAWDSLQNERTAQ